MFGYNNLTSDFPVGKPETLEKVKKVEKFERIEHFDKNINSINVTKVMIWDVGSNGFNDFGFGRERRRFPTGNSEKNRHSPRNYCLIMSVVIGFGIGLYFGLVTLQSVLQEHSSIQGNYLRSSQTNQRSFNFSLQKSSENSQELEGIFVNHSFSTLGEDLQNLSSVTFVRNSTAQNMAGQGRQPEDRSEDEQTNVKQRSTLNKKSSLISDDIYWSDYVESLLPSGFSRRQADDWSRYVRKGAVAVKLERGCGRMQNRLVTFADGRRACVRYRQNTDQIQGELFSFYLSQILNLRNLVPSTVGVVDLRLPLWERLSNEIASAQWHSQRAVVLTQYIPNLDVGSIPKLVRPSESHHLNKLELPEVLDLSQEDSSEAENLSNLQETSEEASNFLNLVPEDNFLTENEDAPKKSLKTWEIIELAQWSDLIIFDYLTANLDRVVNNLYNHQWNSNIMEAPAHNLAKNIDNNLLVFLDNESGLLHGYRLLEKYEAYHGLLLENLCIFRRSTAQIIANLRRDGNVGQLLNAMFERKNPEKIKDILPTIPEKSVKILNGRIRRVHEQILKCQGLFKSD